MKHTALRFLIASLLILVLCLPLFACDSGKTPEDTTAAPADGSETADIVYECDDSSYASRARKMIDYMVENHK